MKQCTKGHYGRLVWKTILQLPVNYYKSYSSSLVFTLCNVYNKIPIISFTISVIYSWFVYTANIYVQFQILQLFVTVIKFTLHNNTIIIIFFESLLNNEWHLISLLKFCFPHHYC